MNNSKENQSYLITNPLAKYIDVQNESVVNFNTIVSLVRKKLYNKGLFMQSNIYVFRVDRETHEIFDISLMVNKIEKSNDLNGFNENNLTYFVQHAINKFGILHCNN